MAKLLQWGQSYIKIWLNIFKKNKTLDYFRAVFFAKTIIRSELNKLLNNSVSLSYLEGLEIVLKGKIYANRLNRGKTTFR